MPLVGWSTRHVGGAVSAPPWHLYRKYQALLTDSSKLKHKANPSFCSKRLFHVVPSTCIPPVWHSLNSQRVSNRRSKHAVHTSRTSYRSGSCCLGCSNCTKVSTSSGNGCRDGILFPISFLYRRSPGSVTHSCPFRLAVATGQSDPFSRRCCRLEAKVEVCPSCGLAAWGAHALALFPFAA